MLPTQRLSINTFQQFNFELAFTNIYFKNVNTFAHSHKTYPVRQQATITLLKMKDP